MGGRCCWAQLWMVKAAAVASRLVIDKGYEKTWREGQMRSSADRKSNGHDERGHADLEGGELAGGNPMRGVGQGEEVCGEGNRAAQSEDISCADADEEILPGGSGWVVRRNRPAKARMAPMAASSGEVEYSRTKGWEMVKRGTKTTTRPVMKADLAAVVRASPAVWN